MITKSGTKALGDWLKDEQATNELKYETLLKLFFGAAQNKEVTINNIESFEKKIKTDLMLLKNYEQTLQKSLDTEDHLYYYLTITFGIESYEAYLRWCTKAKRLLK